MLGSLSSGPVLTRPSPVGFATRQAGGVSSHSFGGLLLGLGLQGTLAHLSNRMVVDLLTPHHDGVAIGVLLGLAAAKMGTEDYQVSKTLRLYLNAAMPATYAEHDFPTMVQVGARFMISCSLGLLGSLLDFFMCSFVVVVVVVVLAAVVVVVKLEHVCLPVVTGTWRSVTQGPVNAHMCLLSLPPPIAMHHSVCGPHQHRTTVSGQHPRPHDRVPSVPNRDQARPWHRPSPGVHLVVLHRRRGLVLPVRRHWPGHGHSWPGWHLWGHGCRGMCV